MSRSTVSRTYIRDLITEVRCAERDGLHEYAERCRRELREKLPRRGSADGG